MSELKINPNSPIFDWDGWAENEIIRLRASNTRLLAALKLLFGYVESGELVRDVTKDGHVDWSLRMMHFVKDLNTVQTAIAEAEKP